MQPGDSIICKVTKISMGKDGKFYITLSYPGALNNTTLVFKELPSTTQEQSDYFTTVDRR